MPGSDHQVTPYTFDNDTVKVSRIELIRFSKSYSFHFTELRMDLVCLAGQYLNETLKACFSCPGGTYNSVPGLNVWCESCIMVCAQFGYMYVYTSIRCYHNT